MNNSDYEINHSEIYNQIKQEIASKQPPQQKKSNHDGGKKIPIEKLTPFLESIQSISNHNLSVATHAQGQIQILQQQLAAEQSKTKKLGRDLKKLIKTLDKTQQAYSAMQTHLNNELSKCSATLTITQQNLQNKENELEQFMKDYKKMQQMLEQLKKEQNEEKKRWIERESHLISEIDQGKQKNLTLYDEISQLKDKLNFASLENQNQQHQIDKLKTNLLDDKKHLEEKSNDWLSQLEQRELKLEKEIRLHESRKAELHLVEKRLIESEASEEKLKIENQDLRKETDRLQKKCEGLQKDAEINFKEKIKDVNESFILRITNLEANIIQANKENQSYMSQISQLTHQLRVSEESVKIFKKECEEFDVTAHNMKKEKEMYLGEFRYLREKYQNTIQSLENEIHKLKLINTTCSEENKDLKSTNEHYRSRLDEILDLHELASLEQENSFFSLLNLLKTKGMGGITKEDMYEVRKEALEQMNMNKTANLIKQQLKRAHNEVEENNYEFQVSDDPWSDLHRKLDQLGHI